MSAFEIQELMSLSWTFVTLREIIRKSLFYLHHLTGENIFSFMTSFARWCVDNGHLDSWYDYHPIEEHALNLVKYVLADGLVDYQVSVEELNRLKQILLYELAPMISIRRNHSAYSGICSPVHSINDINSLRMKDKDDQSYSCFGYIFTDLLLFDGHPELNSAVRAGVGSPLMLIVEVKGNTFRKWLVDIQEIDKLSGFCLYVARASCSGIYSQDESSVGMFAQ